MLRIDGDFVVYQIEEFQSKFNRWMTIADHVYVTIPQSEERNKYHTASGDCWQKTGIHGFFDFEVAKDYCNLLNAEVENGKKFNDVAEVTKFRLLKCRFVQERVPLEFTKY